MEHGGSFFGEVVKEGPKEGKGAGDGVQSLPASCDEGVGAMGEGEGGVVLPELVRDSLLERKRRRKDTAAAAAAAAGVGGGGTDGTLAGAHG